MLLILLPLLVGLATEPQLPAQTGAAAPATGSTDLKQNIANLSSLDYPVRMHAARLSRRTPEAQAVPALVEAARNHSDEYVRYRALVLLTAFNHRGTRDLMRVAREEVWMLRVRGDRSPLSRNEEPALSLGADLV